MSETETINQCPECNGVGWKSAVRPKCCGNLSKGGECRGDCAEPEEYQEVCGICGGAGELS